MTQTRQKQKGRQSRGSFLLLPHDCINCDNFTQLSPRAVKLLIDIASQFRGKNNGDLASSWSLMTKRGWTSKDQLEKAREELLRSGWIVLTRRGRRPRIPSLYALTWLPIDECGGKLDRAPRNKPLGYWKTGTNPEHTEKIVSDPRHTGQTDPSLGSIKAKLGRDKPATRVEKGENNTFH